MSDKPEEIIADTDVTMTTEEMAAAFDRLGKPTTQEDVEIDEPDWEVTGMRCVQWNEEQTRHLLERLASAEGVVGGLE